MKRACTDVENNIIWQSQDDILPNINIAENKSQGVILQNEQFWINGGTVIECVWEPKEGELLLVFAEDNYRDAQGRVCCFHYPVSKHIDMKFGDRILLVYCANGAYFPMLLNERTKGLIPPCPPEYFYQTNWREVERLPHPLALTLENDSTAMNETDKEMVKEKFRKVGKLRVRDKVGVFLLGLAAFIMFAFIFLVMITDEMIEEIIPILIGLGLVPALSIVAMIVFALLLKLSRTAPIKKLNYKKTVLFHSIQEDADYVTSVRMMYVCEKINNRIVQVGYPVGFNNLVVKDMYYGQILHKCSKDVVTGTNDINYFY